EVNVGTFLFGIQHVAANNCFQPIRAFFVKECGGNIGSDYECPAIKPTISNLLAKCFVRNSVQLRSPIRCLAICAVVLLLVFGKPSRIRMRCTELRPVRNWPKNLSNNFRSSSEISDSTWLTNFGACAYATYLIGIPFLDFSSGENGKSLISSPPKSKTPLAKWIRLLSPAKASFSSTNPFRCRTIPTKWRTLRSAASTSKCSSFERDACNSRRSSQRRI